MNNEKLGGLIDGVYAIAMTILALGLPIPESGLELDGLGSKILSSLVDYSFTFIMIFAFWYNQRRINNLVTQEHSRTTLWLNGIALMLVCLFPYAANLAFNLGNPSVLLSHPSRTAAIEYSNLIDWFFTAICLGVDLITHMILGLTYRANVENQPAIRPLMHSRKIATALLLIAMLIALIIPGPNRLTLLVIPLILVCEKEVTIGVDWLVKFKFQSKD